MITILAVIYIVFISLGLPDSVFGVAWPVLHTDLGIAESFASVYSIIVGLCTGGASFLAGVLLRKFGTPRVTFVSILVTSAGLFGMSFANNIWMMIIFAIVLGYGAGAIDTGLNNYVALHYKARHMSWLHCFWGVGVTLSPIIMSAFLKNSGDWRVGYRVIAVIQLCIALIVLVFLRKWIKIDAPADDENTKNQKGSLKIIFSEKGILLSILSIGFYCSMEFIIGTWGATYFVNVFSFSPDRASLWVSLYYGGIMLGRFISGFIADKLKDDCMILGGLGLSFIGAVLLAVPSGAVAAAGLLIVGTGFGPVFPSILHSIPSRFGSEFSSDITGFHMGGAYALGFISQFVFGFVGSRTTFSFMPFLLMAFAALSAFSTVTASKKSKKNITNV